MLCEDLAALWNHPETPIPLKKRILRTVLTEIIVDNEPDPQTHRLRLHWAGGVHSEPLVERNRPGHHRHAADRSVIDLAHDLSQICENNAALCLQSSCVARTLRASFCEDESQCVTSCD